MPEYVRTGYARLFEVRLLHHYWLDDGASYFHELPAAKRTQRLLQYDVQSTLGVEPSVATATKISGLRGVFRATGLGFVVAVPDDAVVPPDDVYEFYVTVRASDYANYTSFTLRPQTIVDVTDPADGTVHRYKANVPTLSNLTGTAHGTGPNQRLYLSQGYATDNGDGVEALVVSGSTIRQLTTDTPGTPFQEIGDSDKHPVYVHQNDVPTITPPVGSLGAPARGIELLTTGNTRVTDRVPADVVGVIRLTPTGAATSAFNFIDNNGHPRTPTRVFEVHFKNRSTIWKYLKKGDGSNDSTEANPLPLTYFGNAGTKQKPSTLAIAIERDTSNPPKVTALVSEIYV